VERPLLRVATFRAIATTNSGIMLSSRRAQCLHLWEEDRRSQWTRPAVSFRSQCPDSIRWGIAALRPSPHLSPTVLSARDRSDPGRARSTVLPGIAALASTLLLAGLLAIPSSAGAATPHNAALVTSPGLGAAAPYSVLGSTVTNTGTTVVGGDLGVGTTLSGFPPGVVDGVENVGVAAAPAQAAMATASTSAAAEVPTGADVAGDQGGVTIDPGCTSVERQSR